MQFKFKLWANEVKLVTPQPDQPTNQQVVASVIQDVDGREKTLVNGKVAGAIQLQNIPDELAKALRDNPDIVMTLDISPKSKAE